MSCVAAVNVNPVQSRLLQLAAFKGGFTWADGKTEVSDVRFSYLFFYNDNHILRDNDDDGEYVVPFEAAMEYVLTGNKIWKDAVKINLGKYTAFVMPDVYIKAGCLTLKKEEVEQLLTAYNTPKQRVIYHAVYCNAEVAKAILKIGKKLGWYSTLDGDEFRSDKNTVYFKPNYKEGQIGYDSGFTTRHPDGIETEFVSIEKCLIDLTNGTISPNVEKQTVELTLNGKDFVITPGVSIEVKREMTLDSIQVDQLATAWKE